MRILGVDTSLRSTGIAVIESRAGKLHAVEYDTIKNSPKSPHSECLRRLYEGVTAVIERTRPDVSVVEGGFYFKNARTAMVLGEARGVVIAACASAGMEVYEYSPRNVKQALTGFGGAGKQQVSRMVHAVLGLSEEPQEDAADALAIAICHAQNRTGIADLQRKPI